MSKSKVGEGRMVFNGISKVFSTKDDRQYETIGAFWDEFSKKYGREKLRGLGYNYDLSGNLRRWGSYI